jgi:hypothetical protein
MQYFSLYILQRLYQFVLFSHFPESLAHLTALEDSNSLLMLLHIEAILAKTQARLGIIPQSAAEEIAAHCQ